MEVYFWKKYLNENLIKFDENLLRNFYKNKGYYDVKINSSFAKLVDLNEFELVYNIDAGKKYYFGELKINMSLDYNQDNFGEFDRIFTKLKGDHYSIDSIDKIVKKIDETIIREQFESVKATVTEKIVDDKIHMIFLIDESEKFSIERINILGNNVLKKKL